MIKRFKSLFIKADSIQHTAESIGFSVKRKTNKQKRDDWLKLKGYTVMKKRKKKPIKTNQISSFRQQVINLARAKKNGSKIMIIDGKAIRNKQGIPILE